MSYGGCPRRRHRARASADSCTTGGLGGWLTDLLEGHPGQLIVPQLVVTEVAYLLETRLGADAEVRFLGDLAAGG
jgi:hypothetical protein